jgi:hypothetical protein
MRRSRDNNRGPAFEQWRSERQAEIDAEKAAQDAAAAQNPTAIYAATANAEAEATRQLVLTGRLSDTYMSGFGTIVRQPFTEAQVDTAMSRFMADTADYVKTKANAKVLIEFLYRNNISPAACSSYRIGHAILKLWAAYPDLEKPVAQITQPAPKVVAEPVLTPSEAAAKKYHDDRTIIVVTDPATGQQFTEFDLSRLNAVEERRLRRIAEKGNSFGSVYEGFLDVKDAQFARDQEIARRAAEEQQ